MNLTRAPFLLAPPLVCFCLGGCPSESQSAGNPQADREAAELSHALNARCGIRTARTRPAAGFVQAEISLSFDVEGKETGLAAALGHGADCSNQFDFLAALSSSRTIFEIDATGLVVRSFTLSDQNGEKTFSESEDGRTALRVVAGCLFPATRDPNGPGDEFEFDPDDFAAQFDADPTPDSNPCGEEGIALPIGGGDPNETASVCVRVESNEGCLDCAQTQDWSVTFSSETRYTALESARTSSLLCGGQGAVQIAAGEVVVVRLTYRIVFAPSAHPSALGYVDAAQDNSEASPAGFGSDPNGRAGFDPSAFGFDPNALTFDPNAFAFDPDSFDFDPGSFGFDPDVLFDGVRNP